MDFFLFLFGKITEMYLLHEFQRVRVTLSHPLPLIPTTFYSELGNRFSEYFQHFIFTYSGFLQGREEGKAENIPKGLCTFCKNLKKQLIKA